MFLAFFILVINVIDESNTYFILKTVEIYNHYKNKAYEGIEKVTSENFDNLEGVFFEGEPVTEFQLYRGLYIYPGRGYGAFWLRPFSMFHGKEGNKKRFIKIGYQTVKFEKGFVGEARYTESEKPICFDIYFGRKGFEFKRK